MSDKTKHERAISILEERGTIDVLLWLSRDFIRDEFADISERRVLDDDVDVDIEFRFESDTYRFRILGLERNVFTDSKNGEAILGVNGEIVMHVGYSETIEYDEIVNIKHPSLRFGSAVKVLKLADWVDKLPLFLEKYNNAKDAFEKEEMESLSKQTDQNIDLGKFE